MRADPGDSTQFPILAWGPQPHGAAVGGAPAGPWAPGEAGSLALPIPLCCSHLLSEGHRSGQGSSWESREQTGKPMWPVGKAGCGAITLTSRCCWHSPLAAATPVRTLGPCSSPSTFVDTVLSSVKCTPLAYSSVGPHPRHDHDPATTPSTDPSLCRAAPWRGASPVTLGPCRAVWPAPGCE